MLTDPIQVTVFTPPDKFLHLTSTAWAAIASFVAAGTTLALVIFNVIYLRLVHKQSDAASTQVELTRDSLAVATGSLNALKKQMTDQEERERHTVIALLGQVVDELAMWTRRAGSEFRSPDSRIALIPESWELVISYLSRRAPELALRAYQAARDLRELQLDLNRYVQIETGRRGGNSSIQQIYESLQKKFENCFVQFNALLNDIHGL